MVGPAAGATRAESSIDSPFKGQSSFEVEDEVLFFGREAHTRSLTYRILSSRMTVLHAPSGAGKTSLLNARIVPNLEREGWMVIKTRPETHPTRAIKNAVVQYLAPPPEAEVVALRRALHLLGLEGHTTLSRLVAHYQTLRVGDTRRQTLLAPPSGAEAARYLPAPAYERWQRRSASLRTLQPVRPLACRMLSSTMPWDQGVQQWQLFHDPEAVPSDHVTAPTVDAACDLLLQDRTAYGYSRILAVLLPPFPGLLAFFRNLTPWCCLLRASPQMVLVLDQFEEIFTRFQDPGRLAGASAESNGSGVRQRGARADWRLRREFFTDLEELYLAARDTVPSVEMPDPSNAADSAALIPLRFLIALRDEYVGRLSPIRRFAPELVDAAYRLDLLSPSQARDAIEKPAALKGRAVERECADEIVTSLQVEDEFIEPGPLQLVCQHLWSHTPNETAITRDALEAPGVGGVSGILDQYFRETVDAITVAPLAEEPPCPPEYIRLELLDILDMLVTSSGTRNVVEQNYLTNVPYRKASRRLQLLNLLEANRLVRRDARGTEEYYEITHEFLIAPIRAELTRVEKFGEVARALSALRHALDYPYELMDPASFAVLHTYREGLEWDAPTSEVMLRNAVANAGNDMLWGAVNHWATALRNTRVLEDPGAALKRKSLGLTGLRSVIEAGPDAAGPLTTGRRTQLLRAVVQVGEVDAAVPLIRRLLDEDQTT
jgi:hypothetical protein